MTATMRAPSRLTLTLILLLFVILEGAHHAFVLQQPAGARLARRVLAPALPAPARRVAAAATATPVAAIPRNTLPPLAASYLESLEASGGGGAAKGKDRAVKDVLAGVVVALASVPSSIAFANIAGCNPLVGLWSSVVLGLTSALWGGRSAMITGSAGVVVVPLAPLVASSGTAFMSAAIALAGVFEVAFGLLGLGKLAGLVSEPILYGFLNALGLLIGQSQLKVFTGLARPALLAAVAAASGTAAVTTWLPRVTTAVPSALAGVALTSVLARLLALPLTTLAEMAGASTFAGGLATLPRWSGLKVPLTAATWDLVFPVAATVATISLLETLLTQMEVDDKLGKIGSDANRSCVGLGIGNVLSACLGGFGGSGLIPQTILNLSSGGKGTASAVAYAVSMASFVLVLAPLIGAIPLASLAGVMLTVAFNTVAWKKSLSLLKSAVRRQGRGQNRSRVVVDGITLVATSLTCYRCDMARGILLGIALDQIGKLIAGERNETRRLLDRVMGK